MVGHSSLEAVILVLRPRRIRLWRRIQLKMYYTYVLKSVIHKTLYVGSSENPEKRLAAEHNTGKVRYTKGRMPWVIIYKEPWVTRGEAMKREKFLKSGQGRKWLSENIM